jgi:hypothetical protein
MEDTPAINERKKIEKRNLRLLIAQDASTVFELPTDYDCSAILGINVLFSRQDLGDLRTSISAKISSDVILPDNTIIQPYLADKSRLYQLLPNPINPKAQRFQVTITDRNNPVATYAPYDATVEVTIETTQTVRI